MFKLVLVVLALSLGATACDDPCEDLQKKVCDDPVYYKANKQHCELMTDSTRRDALPRDYCQSILDSLKER
jgi:hypothetical protein